MNLIENLAYRKKTLVVHCSKLIATISCSRKKTKNPHFLEATWFLCLLEWYKKIFHGVIRNFFNSPFIVFIMFLSSDTRLHPQNWENLLFSHFYLCIWQTRISFKKLNFYSYHSDTVSGSTYRKIQSFLLWFSSLFPFPTSSSNDLFHYGILQLCCIRLGQKHLKLLLRWAQKRFHSTKRKNMLPASSWPSVIVRPAWNIFWTIK